MLASGWPVGTGGEPATRKRVARIAADQDLENRHSLLERTERRGGLADPFLFGTIPGQRRTQYAPSIAVSRIGANKRRQDREGLL